MGFRIFFILVPLTLDPLGQETCPLDPCKTCRRIGAHLGVDLRYYLGGRLLY